ncbi:hypothetical protein ACW9UR_24750 [Halovulum sp. GXIMD14794]
MTDRRSASGPDLRARKLYGLQMWEIDQITKGGHVMLADIDDPDLTMDEMFRTWPETASVFVKRGMLCVGCHIARSTR